MYVTMVGKAHISLKGLLGVFENLETDFYKKMTPDTKERATHDVLYIACEWHCTCLEIFSIAIFSLTSQQLHLEKVQ